MSTWSGISLSSIQNCLADERRGGRVMTDRHAAYIVVLDSNIREDDARETVLTALRQIRGVLSVEPVIAGPDLHIAEMRARSELTKKLWSVLYPEQAR
jgi:hypothetical protein